MYEWYMGNVRIVQSQCTNGTWLMYEKESLSPALSQGNESPSPTLPQGKGVLMVARAKLLIG